jgi:hypothetical protein
MEPGLNGNQPLSENLAGPENLEWLPKELTK